jgi:hypothetical protein
MFYKADIEDEILGRIHLTTYNLGSSGRLFFFLPARVTVVVKEQIYGGWPRVIIADRNSVSGVCFSSGVGDGNPANSRRRSEEETAKGAPSP